MKRLAMVIAPLLLLACGSKQGSSGSGGTSASSGSTATSAGSSGGASSSGGTTTGASSTTSSSTTSSTSTSGGSSGSSGSTACSSPCANSNDCGGSRSCFNGCCVNTADSCNAGSCAYGPCATGWQCDTSTDCCAPDGGTSGGTSGGTTGGFACSFDGGIVTSGLCSPDCDPGFHCEGGTCVLNGGTGPIQVTLRYSNFDDLDLHVLQPDGCEVWYGNTACPNGGGSLDLDSNAGCGASTVDAENIIYTPLDAGGVTPPSGTYTVRVDMYENCDGASRIPFEVIVRHNGVVDPPICVGFDNPDGGEFPGDNGQAGSGVLVKTFTYP